MTLYALLLVCAGACSNWNSQPLNLSVLRTRDDCEQNALEQGFSVITEESTPVPTSCDSNFCTVPAIVVIPRSVAPYVVYSICRPIAFTDDAPTDSKGGD